LRAAITFTAATVSDRQPMMSNSWEMKSVSWPRKTCSTRNTATTLMLNCTAASSALVLVGAAS
jgi:hypothetical protein